MMLLFSTRKKYWNSIFRHQLGQNVLVEDRPGEKILTAFVFKVKDFVSLFWMVTVQRSKYK